MTPDDMLFCPAVIEADGYKVSDAHERSDQTFSFRQILDQSSNVGISLSVQKMTDGFTKLYEHIQKYNLCEKTGVDYPGEASGTLQPLENWATITGWNVSFGQGVAVTPLQLVRFYGALANDGVEVTPHFLVSKPQTGEGAYLRYRGRDREQGCHPDHHRHAAERWSPMVRARMPR